MSSAPYMSRAIGSKFYAHMRPRHRARLFGDARLRQFAQTVAGLRRESPLLFQRRAFREALIRDRLERKGWSNFWIALAIKLLLPLLLDLLISEGEPVHKKST